MKRERILCPVYVCLGVIMVFIYDARAHIAVLVSLDFDSSRSSSTGLRGLWSSRLCDLNQAMSNKSSTLFAHTCNKLTSLWAAQISLYCTIDATVACLPRHRSKRRETINTPSWRPSTLESTENLTFPPTLSTTCDHADRNHPIS